MKKIFYYQIIYCFGLILAILFLFNINLNAQDRLFSYTDIELLELSVDNITTIELLANDRTTEEFALVSINQFEEDTQLELEVRLPHNNLPYRFKSSSFRMFEQHLLDSRIYKYWNGTLNNDDGSGNLTLFKDDKNGVGGLLSVDGRNINYFPLHQIFLC